MVKNFNARLLLSISIFCSCKTPQTTIPPEDHYNLFRLFYSNFEGVPSFHRWHHTASVVYWQADSAWLIVFSPELNVATDTIYIPAMKGKRLIQVCADSAFTFLLFADSIEQLYRHSFLASFYWYDLRANTVLFSTGAHARAASLSPTGTHLAYWRDHCLHIVHLGKGKKDTVLYLCGSDTLLVGLPDWTYEEEWTLPTAYWWSPSGRYIAFLTFHISNIPEWIIPEYKLPHDTYHRYRYAVAGTPPPIVTLQIADLNSNTLLTLPLRGDSAGYLARLMWLPSADRLLIFWTDRTQRHLRLHLWNGIQLLTVQDMRLSTPTEYLISSATPLSDTLLVWINTDTPNPRPTLELIPLPPAQKPIPTKWTPPPHLYLHSIADIDRTSQTLYLQASAGSLFRQSIYALRVNSDTLPAIPRPVLMPSSGRLSSHFLRWVSPAGTLLIEESGILAPPRYLWVREGKLPATFKDNSWIAYLLDPQAAARIDTIVLQRDSSVIRAIILEASRKKKLKRKPLLVYVYGGPGAQVTLSTWHTRTALWHWWLAQQKWRIALVDGRGSAGVSTHHLWATLYKLGIHESDDIAYATKQIVKKYPTDTTRIAIWGWSYGGYLAGMCLLRHPSVFKRAISVAPVSDWHLYDNIYTERYMGTPQENPTGYRLSSWFSYLDSLAGEWLIVHGTADDNVHIQNLYIALGRARPASLKNLHWVTYPNANHSLSGWHHDLYWRMWQFLKK